MIDELEALVQRAIHVPASEKILVDGSALRQIVEQLRGAAPDEVQMGQRIAAERDRILGDARAQARRIVEEAQSQVHSSLDQEAVVQAARRRARDIHAEAERRAQNLRTEANQYVLGQLNTLETRLQRMLREVQAGQRLLTQEIDEQKGPKGQQQGDRTDGGTLS